jgi:pimeloyl-ACP methyl ester carboxylesterase
VAAFLALGFSAVSANPEVSRETLAAAKPGTVFKSWPLEGAVRPGYIGTRILYRSTAYNGEPVAVTGAILFPAAAAADGKLRDVVAWAHPTTGIVAGCAPTLAPDLVETIQGIDDLASKNYVIVATDYVGLGTGETHPYLIGLGAAYAVLDSVRAARQFEEAHAGERFAVWGHSQGGHAALFAGEAAASYAPELKLVGVAAAAPVTNVAEQYRATPDTAPGRSLISMIVLSWSRVFGLSLDDLVEGEDKDHFEALAADCLQTDADFQKFDQDEKALDPKFLKVDPFAFPPMRKILDRTTPGLLPAGMPVFLAQGTADTIVPPLLTYAHMKRICEGGVKVKLLVMEGGGHILEHFPI